MIIRVQDWIFDVDMSATMEYSSQEAADHCQCAYCRNFYHSVDSAYPCFRPFLAQFGIDIEAPDVLIPYEPTCMTAEYHVKGRILQWGSLHIYADSIPVSLYEGDTESPWNECFTLCIGQFNLPWILDEPVEEVISPANDPSWLTDMMLSRMLPDPNIPES